MQDKKIQHPTAHEFYQYILGRRFDPGAPSEGFEPKFANPVFAVRGPGKIPYGSLRVEQVPQLWFTQQRGIVGIGGSNVQVGQLVGQSLLIQSSD